MAERKTKLRPTRTPKPEGVREASRRAREISDKLAAGGRTFSDSTDIVRADRDSR